MDSGQIFSSGSKKEIVFTYQLIREAMDHIRLDSSIEPDDLRQAFRQTPFYHDAQAPWPIPPDPAYDHDIVTEEEIKRCLNDCQQKQTPQARVILTLYFHSIIAIEDIIRLRWKDVYNFQMNRFYKRSLAAKIPLTLEIRRSLQSYLMLCPECRPKDLVLGAPMEPEDIFRCVHDAINRLTDIPKINCASPQDMRDQIHQILAIKRTG
ncbi:MAG: hypothetical protein LBL26_04935 [Peptococcaceae bacterium]|jgi:integrase|nr:hypothetical protein [Peptococcaceae bacterium]